MTDWRNIRTLSREQMLKRVARFSKLKGSDGGLPDSPLPECRRKLYAVIGFQPPMTDNPAASSPVGEDASSKPAIAIAERFNLGYSKAKPGKKGKQAPQQDPGRHDRREQQRRARGETPDRCRRVRLRVAPRREGKRVEREGQRPPYGAERPARQAARVPQHAGEHRERG